jgi:DNA-binding transcriptional ArsR family regulator
MSDPYINENRKSGAGVLPMIDKVPDGFLEQMAERFRLLGDSTRLAILRSLMRLGEQNVGQIVSDTERGQANVSKHLKQLHLAGLLGRRKDGLQVFYWICDPLVEKLCSLVCDALLKDFDSRERQRK